MFEVNDLSFKYVGRKRAALNHVSFGVDAGETLLVLGPSGCGKSTLALCLNGAIPHAVEGTFAGHVAIDGLDTRHVSMAEMARRVGLVFQDPESQICMLTVEDEVAFGLENLAVPRAEMPARIAEALEWVGLASLRRQRVERLSGGQKQRLALASVLAMRPQVLVFDEPTAQLDPAGAAEVVELLGRLRAEARHTLVIIEHRLDEVMHLVDSVLVLSSGGQIVAHGPPRQVLREHGEWLLDNGVWVPQVTELALALGRQRVSLRPFPLTVAEAAQALSPLLRHPGIPDEVRPKVAASVSGTDALVEVRRLTYQYPSAGRPALDNVSLDLCSRALTAIVGANGAGKSTLARNVARILTPPAGTVWLRGRDVRRLSRAAVAREIGYVFQYPEHQFLGRSLLDDVAFGLRRAKTPDADRIAQRLLDDFGLGRLAPAHPFSLSHGEQRRLSVAAMLALGQDLLLLDEPTFGQDRRNAHMLLDKLAGLAASGKGVVCVTHDMLLVAERAQRAVVFSEGQVIFDGSPTALFAEPALLRRAGLAMPPLVELSQRMCLAAPLVRVADFAALVSAERMAPAMIGSSHPTASA